MHRRRVVAVLSFSFLAAQAFGVQHAGLIGDSETYICPAQYRDDVFVDDFICRMEHSPNCGRDHSPGEVTRCHCRIYYDEAYCIEGVGEFEGWVAITCCTDESNEAYLAAAAEPTGAFIYFIGDPNGQYIGECYGAQGGVTCCHF